MTGAGQPDWRERRRGQTEPGGPRGHVIVDQHGQVRDLNVVNRRLLDPADPGTLRRLLAGLRALNPDWPTTEETKP